MTNQVIYVNGMTTGYVDAHNVSQQIAKLLGKDVDLIHNNTTFAHEATQATTKLFFGIVGALYALLCDKESKQKKAVATGVGIGSGFLIVSGASDFHSINMRKNEKATEIATRVIHYLQTDRSSEVTLVVHSQGADITQCALKRLDRSLRGRINVITIGGAVEIPPFVKSVKNFRHKNDLISHVAASVKSFGVPASVTSLKGRCQTGFCHGATDYIAHPAVQEALQRFAG